MPGTIVSLAPNGDAELNVRGMRVRVQAAELADARPASRKDRQEAYQDAPPILIAATSAAPAAPPIQLDLRACAATRLPRRSTATSTTPTWPACGRCGSSTARAAGRVRAAVREQLPGHALVSRFQTADAREGGDGATEVTLAS